MLSGTGHKDGASVIARVRQTTSGFLDQLVHGTNWGIRCSALLLLSVVVLDPAMALDPQDPPPPSAQPVSSASLFTYSPFLRLDSVTRMIGKMVPQTAVTNTMGDSGAPCNANLALATVKELNGVRFADQYSGATATAKLDAAIAAAGTKKSVIVVPSSMVSGAPTALPDNVTLLDFRGLSPVGVNPGIHFNANTGAGRGHTGPKVLILDNLSNPTMSTLSLWGVHRVTGALPNGENQDGVAGEVQVYGALTAPTTGNVVGLEGTVSVSSTGQSLPQVYGVIGNVNTVARSSTRITDAAAIRAQQVGKAGSGTITNAYGIYLDGQNAGTNNWSLFSNGNLLLANDLASVYAKDSRGTARNLIWPTSTDVVEMKPLNEAKGWQFLSLNRSEEYLLINSRQVAASRPLHAAKSLSIGSGTPITRHLSATSALTFPNTSAPGCSDLNIPVPGAAPEDTVALGSPVPPPGGQFTAFVGAVGSVTVRYCAFVSGPVARGLFRADVWKH